MALHEGRACCGMVKIAGDSMTPERYDALSSADREQVLYVLGKSGLAGISTDFSPPTITVTLSPVIQLVLGCTMFNILNRLEKLDGSINELYSNITLLIQAPLGGKKGLMKCEMLIMQLYPWLHIQEISTDQIAVSPNTVPVTSPLNHMEIATGKKTGEKKPSAKSVEPVVVRDSSGNIRETHDVANGTRVYVQQTETEKKPGFFQRLFGKKKHKAKE